MAILIDPPFWPAHGTVFSHLVSDSSLEELHSFATAAGLPERAFDRDHYDVPERRYADLVAAGALPVPATELVRRLVGSGLRVPARQRPEKLRPVLADAWDRLLPGHPGVGRELIERWSEPHRHYHDLAHLQSVLRALRLLAEGDAAASSRAWAPGLAAWFHDAVYDGVPGRDEERSAELAATLLGRARVAPLEIDETVRLVLLTASHDPSPGDRAGALLSDSDLEVLGRPPAAYARYLRAVRQDYAHVPDAAFAAGRAAVVRGLLERDPLYATEAGRSLWEQRARQNLRSEL